MIVLYKCIVLVLEAILNLCGHENDPKTVEANMLSPLIYQMSKVNLTLSLTTTI